MKLQRLCHVVPAALIALCVAGCSRENNAESAVVFAGIPPVAWLTRQIAGPEIPVATLLPPGQNPHTCEPTARQAASLANAKLLVIVGLPMETQLAKSTAAKIVSLAPNEHDDHDDHDHDPHIWLSVRRLIPLLPAITDGLAATFPDYAADFADRAAKLKTRLAALDAELTTELAPFNGKTFYVYHPAWNFFADDYNLRELAVEKDGKEPTTKYLAELLAETKTHPARVIFCDPFSSRGPVNAFAREAGLSVQTLDPLPGDLPDGLRDAARAICEALQ